MGEIAEDMLVGACCSYCGVYFEREHGYPVLCKVCVKGTSAQEMQELGYQPAIWEGE